MKITLPFYLLALSLLSACALIPSPSKPTPTFRAATFADLPDFAADDLGDLDVALAHSCERLQKLPDDKILSHAGRVADWRPFCTAVLTPGTDVRKALTTYLTPWVVGGPGDPLFTGYYEASLKGSLVQGGPYQTPIRARPLDHVVVADLGLFKPELTGQRMTGQLVGTPGAYTLQPYPTRANIVEGGIPPSADRVLAWVDSPTDAFFLEIQGSGRIDMTDGSVMHVGYDDRNGHPYTAIGKVLVARGDMTPDTASMQTIRAWLSAHPDQAQVLMNENASYIFFRDIGPDGPLGAEGVPLTPLRSLAVDKDIWSYGVPFFLSTVEPRLNRVMVAQDTGGAIKGPVRGDVFWGYGDDAASHAGIMKSPGAYWVLLPRGVDPRR